MIRLLMASTSVEFNPFKPGPERRDIRTLATHIFGKPPFPKDGASLKNRKLSMLQLPLQAKALFESGHSHRARETIEHMPAGNTREEALITLSDKLFDANDPCHAVFALQSMEKGEKNNEALIRLSGKLSVQKKYYTATLAVESMSPGPLREKGLLRLFNLFLKEEEFLRAEYAAELMEPGKAQNESIEKLLNVLRQKRKVISYLSTFFRF